MKILFTIIAICCSVRSYACDACGCSGSLGNMGLGVQAQGNRSSFSFVHSYKIYNTVVNGLYGNPDQHSFEYYNRSEFSGTFRLSHRFQTRVILPIVYNSQVVEKDTRTVQNGLGDIQVGLSYFIIDSAYSMNKIVRWSMGLVSKLPTGKFASPTDAKLMLNPGTGTFDYAITSSLAIRNKRFGLNNETSYLLRTTNKYDYHPGNTWYNQTIGLIILNRFSIGTGISFASNALANYKGTTFSNTNTQALLIQNATVCSFSTGSWSFQLSINTPIHQLLGEGETKQKEAFSFGVYHILKPFRSKASELKK